MVFLFEEGLGPMKFNIQGLNNFLCLNIHLHCLGRAWGFHLWMDLVRFYEIKLLSTLKCTTNNDYNVMKLSYPAFPL